MEEKYWGQFLETGKVADYLMYKNIYAENSPESEEIRESDYSDRDGAFGITHR